MSQFEGLFQKMSMYLNRSGLRYLMDLSCCRCSRISINTRSKSLEIGGRSRKLVATEFHLKTEFGRYPSI